MAKRILTFCYFSFLFVQTTIRGIPIEDRSLADNSLGAHETNTIVLPRQNHRKARQDRSNVPGEPLSPEEFQKASQITKPKHSTVDPNDPTNEDIIDISKPLNNKGSRQKDVVEQWEKGRIPYVLDSDFDEDQRLDMAKAIQEFEEETCIRFVPADLDKDDDYVFIENTEDGCKSPIGHKGGRQTIRLADNCFDQFGRLLHEMLHTVGFVHEQSRTDRDKFVFVDYDVIKEEYEHNFEKRDPPAGNYAGEYDTRSVLHYSAQAFADPRHEITIYPYFDEAENLGQRDSFSKKDVDKVNKWYKCKPKRQTRKKVPRAPCGGGNQRHGEGCINSHPNCTEWAKENECSGKNSNWMTVNCRLACNKCEESCKDLNEKCFEWARQGYCEEYDDFMIPYCSKSCSQMEKIALLTNSNKQALERNHLYSYY